MFKKILSFAFICTLIACGPTPPDDEQPPPPQPGEGEEPPPPPPQNEFPLLDSEMNTELNEIQPVISQEAHLKQDFQQLIRKED